MIRKTDAPPFEEILKAMSDPENLPRKLGGRGETDTERLEAKAALLRITADPDKIRAVCIGCSDDMPMREAAMCECGGFVCAACQRLEEEGVCDHQKPALLDGVPEDEDDDD
jgi:hypothetical protein